ncbi:MAG: DUF3857 domain-containing protein [Spirochaetales bacterium]|nr:DUF3857 domain-containing protein [Spirochaetales bacterium]
MVQELNFQLKTPPAPYVKMNAFEANSDATMAFTRKDLELTFLVIGETLNDEVTFSVEDLVNINKINLKKNLENPEFSGQKEYVVNGLKGISFFTKGGIKGLMVYYFHWVYYTNGYCFQLVLLTTRNDRQSLVNESNTLLSGFTLIDPKRVAYKKKDLSRYITVFDSPDYYYSLNLSGSNWMKWKGLKEDHPDSETGGLTQNGLFFVVQPLYLVERPSLDMLARLYINSYGIDYPGDKIKNFRKQKWNGGDAYFIECEKEAEKNVYEFRMVVYQREYIGYMFMLFGVKGTAGMDSSARDLFKSVSFKTLPEHFDVSSRIHTGEDKKRAGIVHNALGIYYFSSKQYTKSLAFFKLASDMEETSANYMINLADVYDEIGEYGEGLSALRKKAAQFKDNQLYQAWYAYFLQRNRETDEAISVYRTVFHAGFNRDDFFREFTGLLADRKMWDDVDGEYRLYLEKNDSLEMRLSRITMLYRKGDYEKMISLLTGERENAPANADVSTLLVHAYNGTKMHDKALALCDDMIAAEVQTPLFYYLKGQTYFIMKEYTRSMEVVEKGLAISPNNERLTELRDMVSGALGQGNKDGIRDVIDPVPVPKVFTSGLRSYQQTENDALYGAYYIHIMRCYSFKKDEPVRYTVYRKIKVLTEAGVEKFNTLEFDFNPSGENIHVNSLKVFDRKGRLAGEGKMADYYVTDSRDNSMATNDKTLYMPVPNLLPGSIIEVAVTVESFGISDTVRYDRFLFYGRRPIKFFGLSLSGDLNDIEYTAANIGKPLKEKNLLAWYVKNPAVFVYEPGQPFYEKFVPNVIFGDKNSSWTALGKKYLSDIGDKLEPSKEAKAIVSGIVKKGDKTSLKVEKILSYIQKNYTYKAIEFGTRARVPNTFEQIVANKYGDCKDQAVLLYHLLRAAGIKSYLALTNFYYNAEKKIPSLDQFNHMILFVPGYKKGVFLDPTNRDLKPGTMVPEGLANHNALVLNPAKIELKTIPGYPASECIVRLHKTLKIYKRKQLLVTERLQFSGYLASSMRGAFKRMEASEYVRNFQNSLSNVEGNIQLLSIKPFYLYDNKRDFVVFCKYEVKNAIDTSKTQLSFDNPVLWETYYLKPDNILHRRSPYEITYPVTLYSTVTLKKIPYFTFVSPKRTTTRKTLKTAQYGISVRKTSKALTISFSCKYRPGMYKAGDYTLHTDYLESMLDYLEMKVVLRKSKKR